MRRLKVMVFSSEYSYGIERDVNEWLEKNPNVRIKNSVQSESAAHTGGYSHDRNITLTIFYTERSRTSE